MRIVKIPQGSSLRVTDVEVEMEGEGFPRIKRGMTDESDQGPQSTKRRREARESENVGRDDIETDIRGSSGRHASSRNSRSPPRRRVSEDERSLSPRHGRSERVSRNNEDRRSYYGGRDRGYSPRRGGQYYGGRRRDVQEYDNRARRREKSPVPSNDKRDRERSGDKRVPLTDEDRKRKEIEDARREDLTVLVVNLSLKATEKDIWEFFTRHAGKVSDIQLIKDVRSGKSKGIGYVEFHDAESVLKSLNLTDQPIRVQASQGEKNRAAKAAKQQQAELAAQGPTKIYVGGLTDALAGITGDELRQLFSPFGTILQIDVPKDPYTGRNRGYAFVQYRQAQEARDAMAAMHCFDIGGKQIKVGFAGDEQPRTTSTASTVDVSDGQSGRTTGYFSPPKFQASAGVDLDKIADDHDDRLLHGGALMRLALSQKLQQKSNDQIPLFTSTAAQLIASGVGGGGMDSVAQQLRNALSGSNRPLSPTNYLCLSNMFTKEEAENNGPELLDEVAEDVRTECQRFGEVIELYINSKTMDGRVYIHFVGVDGAVNSQKALHGRSYGGIAVSASFIDESTFRAATEG